MNRAPVTVRHAPEGFYAETKLSRYHPVQSRFGKSEAAARKALEAAVQVWSH